MIDWKTKLCSRKLWMAICGLVSGVLLAARLPESEVNEIAGIILATGSVIAYILGEGWADAAAASGTVIVQDPEEKTPEEKADE